MARDRTSPLDDRVWLDRLDAARYLGLSPRTIDRMVDDGRLRAYRLPPRGVRLKVADLDAVLERIPAVR